MTLTELSKIRCIYSNKDKNFKANHNRQNALIYILKLYL